MVLVELKHESVAVENTVKQRIEALVSSKPIKLESIARYLEKTNQTHPDHDAYSCYAIPLLLPSDKDAREYMKTFAHEIDLISGKNCLVIGFTKSEFKNLDSDDWGDIIDGKTHQEYGVKISDLFGIGFTQFPCMVVFEDIHSSNHIVVTLKGMTVEEISEVMKEIFSIIRKAVSKNKSPLDALEKQRKKEKYRAIISELRSLGEKTFETVIEALIKTFLK